MPLCLEAKPSLAANRVSRHVARRMTSPFRCSAAAQGASCSGRQDAPLPPSRSLPAVIRGLLAATRSKVANTTRQNGSLILEIDRWAANR